MPLRISQSSPPPRRGSPGLPLIGSALGVVLTVFVLTGTLPPWSPAAAEGGGQEYRAPVSTTVHGAQPPTALPAPDNTAAGPAAGGLLPADRQTALPPGFSPGTAPQSMPQAANAGQAVLPPAGLPAPPENSARTQGTADLQGNNFSDPGQALQWRDPQTGDVITSVVPPRQKPQTQNPGLLFIAPQVYPDRPYGSGNGGSGQGWNGMGSASGRGGQ